MKTVLLLRHAKSSWDNPSLQDQDRPLAPRGRKAAPKAGAYMARKGLIPDRVLCSSARRAMETWELAAPSFPEEIPAEVLDELYHAHPAQVLEVIRALPPGENIVLLIGHNPTFEELALMLTGTGEPRALDDLDRKYPTGALAVLDFLVEEWSGIREGSGHLRAFVRPKKMG